MKAFPYFQILSALMLAGGLVFFWECVTYLGKRDYVAAGMLTLIGVFTLWVGGELARLALAERSS